MRATETTARLELAEAEGAFRALEDWLEQQRFFTPTAAGLIADLYLGYGLSETIRRERTPSPPEPCHLPLLACVVRKRAYAVDHADNDTPGGNTFLADSAEIGPWEPSWSAGEYEAAIERVREAIARGDVYQVNLVQHLSASFDGDAAVLASSLSSGLARFDPLIPEALSGEAWSIVSASPELFLARRGRRVWTMPIKGTRPAGSGDELAESEKDAAEHVMIVDLERNDLSRVCEPGSVRWPELKSTRSLAGVEHMVSTVKGILRGGVGLAELLEATFPGGSVTGAPKIAAVDLIAALEPVGRGASMGALGHVYPNGDLDLALTIRTFCVVEGRIHLWVGGGVVWDSDPRAEVEESWTKARPLLEAIGAPYGTHVAS